MKHRTLVRVCVFAAWLEHSGPSQAAPAVTQGASHTPLPGMTRDFELHATIVATPRDCQTRLEFAHVFERPRPGRIRSASIALVGDPDDAAMTTVRKLFSGLQVRAATRRDMELAYAVQPLQTPVILLHTPSLMLRMALQAPRTVKSADALVRWLSIPVIHD